MIFAVTLVAFGCGTSSPPAAKPATVKPERVKPSPRAVRLPPLELVGCYALYNEAGQPASRSLYFASDRVRLEAREWGRPNTWDATRLGADGGIPEDGRQGRNVYWAVDSLAADTIHVHIHTGFSGSELILGVRPASDTLYGRALEHWDMGPSTNDAGRVTAIRVACVPGTG